eukprot:TRINITY_DN14985_c0_g1_i6.p1 TRINITY_DN14985_c0_g1~~TRINITY_DN14985_c0_g1_i6.p1  ORF type:complete len:167 (-),score=34.64 TRINITY_DN14985_c0_g1_i6:364-864(-)
MGGHGGLNILPQKRWNVYNYDNREVVNRDREMVRQERERRERQKRSQKLKQQIQLAKGEVIALNPQEELKVSSTERYAEENELYKKALKKQKKKEQQAKEKILSATMKPVADNGHVNLFLNEELNDKVKHMENHTEHPTKVSSSNNWHRGNRYCKTCYRDTQSPGT